MNDLTKALLSEINSQAKATYPNAVALVDLNLHFSNIGKNGDNILLAGQAAATALVKRKAPAPQPIAPPMAMAPPMPIAPPMAAPVVMSQPMAGPVPSQPMDMAMASQPMAVAPPVPMPSQPMALPIPEPMAQPVPSQPLAPAPAQGGRRNRRKTLNKRNYKRSRKNRR